MKKRSTAGNEQGFTLAEIIVASGVLAVITATVIQIFVNSIRLSESARNMTTAVTHADFVLEGIRSATFANLCTSINTNNLWTWDTATVASKGLSALRDESIVTTCSGTGLLNVAVTVSWHDRALRNRSVVITTQTAGL